MNYTDKNRGVIQNRERSKQVIDYSGIRYGNITPTDIDGFIEYHDKVYIFYEFKRKGYDMPHGQKLAFMRLVDALFCEKKFALLIRCEHDTFNPNDDIDAANAIVTWVYFGNGSSKEGKLRRTVKEVTDDWIEYADSHDHPLDN